MDKYQRYIQALWKLNKIAHQARIEGWPMPKRIRIVRSKRKLRDKIQMDIFLFPKINYRSIGMNPQVKGGEEES